MADPCLPGEAHRYLDIGCGVGGGLVAFSKLGFEVCGLEINQQLIELANANCSDHGLSDCVLPTSILEEGLTNLLGTFDVITMLSVIEHVADVPKTLEHAASLLAPGGILIMEIPNKDSLSMVAEDPHYSLFGITLLERPSAIQYFCHFFPIGYDVGEYYELGFYRSRLEEWGCKTDLLPSRPRVLSRAIDFPLYLVKLAISYAGFLVRKRKALPAALSIDIKSRFIQYFSGMARELTSLLLKPSRSREFRLKYLDSVWTVAARKK
jgi:SAM-dependent methyltransferase